MAGLPSAAAEGVVVGAGVSEGVASQRRQRSRWEPLLLPRVPPAPHIADQQRFVTSEGTVGLLVAGLLDAAVQVLCRLEHSYVELAIEGVERRGDGHAIVIVELPISALGLSWLEVMQHWNGHVFVSNRVPLLITDVNEVADELSNHFSQTPNRLAMPKLVSLLKMLASIMHPTREQPVPTMNLCARVTLIATAQGWNNTIEEVVDSVRNHNMYTATELLYATNHASDIGLLTSAIMSGKADTVAMVMTLMEEARIPLGITDKRGTVGMSPLHWAAKRGISSIVNLLIANSPAVADAWSSLRGGPLNETPERMMAKARGAPGVGVSEPSEQEPSEWDGTLGSHFVDEQEATAPGRQASQPGANLPPAWHTDDHSQQGADWNSGTLVGASALYHIAQVTSRHSMDRFYLGLLLTLWLLPRWLSTSVFVAVGGVHCLIHIFTAEYSAAGLSIRSAARRHGVRVNGALEFWDGSVEVTALMAATLATPGGHALFFAYVSTAWLAVSLTSLATFGPQGLISFWPILLAAVAATLTCIRFISTHLRRVTAVCGTHVVAHCFVNIILAAHMAACGPWLAGTPLSPIDDSFPTQLSITATNMILEVALAWPQAHFVSSHPRNLLPTRAAHVLICFTGTRALAVLATTTAGVPTSHVLWPCFFAPVGFSSVGYICLHLKLAVCCVLDALERWFPSPSDAALDEDDESPVVDEQGRRISSGSGDSDDPGNPFAT